MGTYKVTALSSTQGGRHSKDDLLAGFIALFPEDVTVEKSSAARVGSDVVSLAYVLTDATREDADRVVASIVSAPGMPPTDTVTCRPTKAPRKAGQA